MSELDKPMPLEAYSDEMILEAIDFALTRQNQIENELKQLTDVAIKRKLIPQELPEN